MKLNEIKALLPAVFQRTLPVTNEPPATTTPLGVLLELMEQLPARSEEALTRLDATFDPRRTDDAFVPYLASWVDLDRLFEPMNPLVRTGRPRPPFSTGLGRLRELTASAAWLAKWRGTVPGLRRFLQVATGDSEIEILDHVDRDGKPRLFHFTVRVPARLKPHHALIERIIDSEKPAYTTYELVL